MNYTLCRLSVGRTILALYTVYGITLHPYLQSHLASSLDGCKLARLPV